MAFDKLKVWVIRKLSIPLGIFLLILARFFLLHGLVWHFFALLCMFMGCALNVLVFLLNKKMPVKNLREGQEGVLHCPLTEKTRFPLLADRIDVFVAYISIGDILAITGLLLWFGTLFI